MRFLLWALIFAPVLATAQDTQGYYITNDGVRHEMTIRASELENLNNPDASFVARSGGNEVVVKATDIVEAGLTGDTKFRKFTVQLDDAELYNVRLADLKPMFESKVLFLNVLTEGAASLFVYESAKGDKYFYTSGAKTLPEQLIYRKARAKMTDDIQENTTYRQQLQQDVACENDPWSKFRNVKYQKKELIAVFEAYNACNGGAATVTYSNERKSKIVTRYTLYTTPKFVMTHVDSERADESAFSISFGGEFEAITAGRQWGFFIRAEYEIISFTASRVRPPEFFHIPEKQYKYDGGLLSFSPGVRYHFNNAAKNHLFVDCALAMVMPIGDLYSREKLTFINNGNVVMQEYYRYDTVLGYGVSVGAGWQFLDHYRVQARYESPRQITSEMASGGTLSTSTFGLSLGYTF